MKTILFYLIIFTSLNLYAGFFPVGKDGAKTNYSSIEKCREVEQTDCYDITGKKLEYWEIETTQVDDTENPVYKDKYKQVACADPADCGSKVAQITDIKAHCNEGDNDMIIFTENKLMPGWSYYCTAIIGYPKIEIKKLVENPDKKKAYENSQAAAKVKADSLAKVQAAISFGQSLKNEIYLINASKKLSGAQVKAFVEEFQTIDRLLSVGAIDTARGDIQAIQVGPLVSEEEKQIILDKINAFLGN